MLQADAGEAFLPVVRSFVETAAVALGMEESEALGLTLASEEVFLHLIRIVLKSGEKVEISCTNGGYYVRVDFMFSAPDIDLRAFNLNATVSFDDDAGLDEMGLVLASRSVDRFAVTRMDGARLKLTLLKEKAYPSFEGPPPALPKPMDDCAVRPPNPEELKLFAHLVKTCYQEQTLPEVFSYPGKLVDMVAGANYGAAVAAGKTGEIGGGMFWHRTGEKAVECFGPYLFNQEKSGPAISGALLESCIGAVARTSAIVLVNRFAIPGFAGEDFEPLGSVRVRAKEGGFLRREAWFRLIHEDPGGIAWTHPELEDFLSREYGRLVLPREMRHVTNDGERQSGNSVISTTFDRSQASATLRPIWFGTDFRKNLGQHLELLRHEGVPNIFFTLDAGISWQAAFTPGLLQNGFRPCLVFPCAGSGDVVLFQFQETAV